MDNRILGFLFYALLIGVAIGIQVTISGRLGQQFGPLRTALLIVASGGIPSALMLLLLKWDEITVQSVLTPAIFAPLLFAGLIGIAIVGGSAYVMPQIGVAAASATIVLGQLLVAAVVDTTGISGVQIPLTPERIIGFVLLLVAVWLISPK